jgi:hypothetical protein
MNLWECQHKGCKSTAVGTGSAAGLLAIGWFFELGPVIFCPIHNPKSTYVLTDLQNAIGDTLEFCISQHGKTQLGYFSPGGWAYEQLIKEIPENYRRELLDKYRQVI